MPVPLLKRGDYMSFPVPTKYELTDDKNETVVVYNDGREERLLPWIDGAGSGTLPFEVINTWTFTPEEDITSSNPIRFEIPYIKNVCFLLMAIGDYGQTPLTIIFSCFAMVDTPRVPDVTRIGGGGGITSNGAGTTITAPSIIKSDEKIYVDLPRSGFKLTAGVEYALIAIKLGDMI